MILGSARDSVTSIASRSRRKVILAQKEEQGATWGGIGKEPGPCSPKSHKSYSELEIHADGHGVHQGRASKA
jgi:hypothetical protein